MISGSVVYSEGWNSRIFLLDHRSSGFTQTDVFMSPTGTPGYPTSLRYIRSISNLLKLYSGPPDAPSPSKSDAASSLLSCLSLFPQASHLNWFSNAASNGSIIFCSS